MMPARLVVGIVAVLVSAAPTARGQDEALRDRVAQLVERLDSPKTEARDAAEAALIGLGPRAASLLPESAKGGDADRATRLGRVRAALREAQEQASLGGTKVTLQAEGQRLSEVLKALQSQTGNLITDLREQYGADAANPALDLDFRDTPFLEALDKVAEKAGVAVNFYTGDGTIGLMPGGMDGPGYGRAAAAGGRLYQGAFRVEAQQITMVRNLQAGSVSASLRLDIAWEPKLRPMLLALKAEDLAIADDQGGAIKAELTQESTSIVLRPENPIAELNLNMEAPKRSAAALKSVKIKADVTVPASVQAFRFPSLAKGGVEQKQGEVAVKLVGTEIDEANWLVTVELAYPGGGAAFESYQQGLFNNRLYLQRRDGSVFEHNGGFNQIGGSDGKLAFEYIFVDALGKPADYQLVYETPSKVLTIPLEFELKDLPLP